MIEISDKASCTGCSACASSCLMHCITMKEDHEGFLYPSVNVQACVNCHICEKVCPVLPSYVEGRQPEEKTVYALIHNDAQVRKNSASGGAFALFASQVLSGGGVVYGAAFAPGFQKIQHIRIDTIDKLPLLQGSKYVQSDTQQIFEQVRQDLLEGRHVLFSGTPCQNAGLRKYLGRDYDGLLCVEFICHGVPSPKIWREYLAMIQKKIGGDIKRVLFREKTKPENFGGGELIMLIESENGRSYCAPDHIDPFYNMFMNNKSLRPSCYACEFKTNERAADITIADFWKGESILPGFGIEGDMSLVFLNTPKAQAFFEGTQWQAKVARVEMQKVLTGNTSYYTSVHRPGSRQLLFDDLDKIPFKILCKKHASPTRRQKIAFTLEKMGLLNIVRYILRRK